MLPKLVKEDRVHDRTCTTVRTTSTENTSSEIENGNMIIHMAVYWLLFLGISNKVLIVNTLKI